MKMTDGNRTVEIELKVWDGSNWSPDWSNDFFQTGGLPYDEDAEAYRVDDVDYCIDQANDWKNGIGDFREDDDLTEDEVEGRGVFVNDI